MNNFWKIKKCIENKLKTMPSSVQNLKITACITQTIKPMKEL